MKKETVDTQEQRCITSPYKRISWSAILVGALVGLGLSFLLNLFGLAIGLSATTAGEDGAMALAIGGVIGVIIAIIASMVAAGYAAGYLGRLYCPGRNLGILYGFTTWSVALLLAAAVAAQVNNYATTYSQAVMGTTLITAQSSEGKVNRDARSSSNEKKSTLTKIVVTPNCLIAGAFILFILFFIGAVSACVGACWGMNSKRED
jgi:hypothetical protein